MMGLAMSLWWVASKGWSRGIFRRVRLAAAVGLVFAVAPALPASAQIGTGTTAPTAVEAEPSADPATGQPLESGATDPALSGDTPADGPTVDGFTVTGVAVAAEAASTGQARTQAFAEGQRIALQRLAESLGGEVDFSTLSEQAVTRLIQGFQVEEERVSPGRYEASLAFTFRPDEVRAVVRDQVGTGGAAAPSSPAPTTARTPTGAVLVIPLWQTAETVRLWDAPNPWHDAWLNRANAADAVPIVVPFGDLQDVGDLSIDQAVGGDRAALQAMAERYGAGQPVVATLSEQGGGYRMTLDWFPPGEAPSEEVVPVAALGGASTLPQAVEEAALRIQRGPLPPTVGGPTGPALSAGPGGGGQSLYIVPIADLQDWVDIRGRLDRIPAIVTTTVVSLQPGEAVVELQTVGTDSALRDQMAQQQLGLELGAGGMEIRRLNRL